MEEKALLETNMASDTQHDSVESLRVPARRKLSPKKLLFGITALLIALVALHRPLSHCYRRISSHVCRHGSFEARARRLLKNYPLIGM
jgi:hypothetical protein